MPQGRHGQSRGPKGNTASQSSQRSKKSQHSQSQSQGGGSSSQMSLPAGLSIEEFDEIVTDVVEYILEEDNHKYPIKQHDIKENVANLQSKYYKHVMNRAKDVLMQIFGLRLVEVEPGTHTSYILMNGIAGSGSSTAEEVPEMVVLQLVLSLILMRGGCVTDDEMWKFLSELKVFEENTLHDFFGDVKNLVTEELVKKLYLKYTRIPDTDPPKYEFRWGRRAEEEMNKEKINQFVAKIFNQDPMSAAQNEEIAQRMHQS